MMYKVRIKAVRQADYKDLQEQFENPIEHACDIKVGDTFVSVDGKKPDGLCDSAWNTMKDFVIELANGGGNFFDGWMKNPHSAMLSCNDGFRPVSFYVERIEE
jgi:uncharacterized repeat protein (TIGR04076 family)